MGNFLRALRRVCFLFVLASIPAASFAGFSISNGRLVDDNGVPFVMRGINYPYTWYAWRGDAAVRQDLANIAATGSNTVRIVLSTGGQWARINGAQVTQVIEWCKALRMIPVLEAHDSTGWSEQSTAVHIDNAVQYWTSADIRAAIDGQENFVIVNIANEPFGNTTTANYMPDMAAAIQALRAAGLTHTLMIDGATWGQDWSNTMRANALQLWNADARRNLVFSVHMYEVYQSVTPVAAYMQAFQDMNLPLVVGEFGPINNGQFVDSESVIAQAQTRGLGYIGWSWSGNGGGGAGLDMTVNFDPAQLTAWGNRIVNGASGIKTTSVYATVFPPAGSNSLVVAPTAFNFPGTAASRTVAVTANVSWSVTNNTGFATISPLSGTGNGNIVVNVPANANIGRSAAFTVSGGGITRQVLFTQDPGAPAAIDVSTPAVSLAAGASTGAFVVSSNIGWGVSSNQSWLTVAPANGSGAGIVTVTAAANPGTTARTASVLVSGGGLNLITRTVTVTQAGQPPSSALEVSATSLSFTAAASSQQASIIGNVNWNVTDNQTWITVSPASGFGNGTITVSVAANTGTAARTGAVTVSGGTFTRNISVTQAGQPSPNPGGGTCANPVTFSGNTGNFNTCLLLHRCGCC